MSDDSPVSVPFTLHAVAVILAAEAGGCRCVTDRAGCLAQSSLEEVLGAEVVHRKNVSIQDLIEGRSDDLSASQLDQLLLDPASGESLLR